MTNPLKVLFHTQYYPPETGAPQSRISELAQGISNQGFLVTVLTAMPNYPTGKLFPGYRSLYRKEQIDGITVYRSFIIPSQSAGLLKRMLNYFSFVCSSFWVGLFLPKPDLILTESPPLFLGISGYFLSRFKRAKWIFNIADLWPKSALELSLIQENSIFYKLSTWLESFCYRHANLVTGQSKTILADITTRFPNVKTYHLSNSVNPSKFGTSRSPVPGPRSETEGSRRMQSVFDRTNGLSASPLYSRRVQSVFDRTNGLNASPSRSRRVQSAFDCTNEVINSQNSSPSVLVLYAGLHGLAQGLDQLLNAANHLCDHPEINFVLVGDGPEKPALINQAKKLNLNNIEFFDPIPKSEIPDLLASADILIVPLKIQLTGAVPSKLYEAMAAGKALILIAGSEAADIVIDADCGVVVEPGDTEGLVNAIQKLASDPAERDRLGVNGRIVAIEKYDRSKIAKNFADYLLTHFSSQ